MSRKTITFKLASSSMTREAEEKSTQETWVVSDGAHSLASTVPFEADAHPGEVDLPTCPMRARGMMSDRGSVSPIPNAVATCFTLVKGADAIGRIWSEGVLRSARRRAEGGLQLMMCWTPVQAALVQRDLASESLSDAFLLSAPIARVAEQTSREAAAISPC